MEKDTYIVNTTGGFNCGGRCALTAHVKNGKIVGLSAGGQSKDNPDPSRRACARCINALDTFNRNDRLKHPLLRTSPRGDGMFKRITWDEAIDLIYGQWTRIRDTYGAASRFVQYSTGNSALLRGDKFAKRLLALDGGYLGRYNSYSTACVSTVSAYMYGTISTGNSMADILNSELIILWGHNPAETIFDGLMHWLRAAKRAGIPIVCVDPRYSATAKALDAEWIPIRPTTDSALCDGMAYIIITEDLYDKEFITKCCQGFTPDTLPLGVGADESYFSYVLGKRDGIAKTPRWASEITGIPAEKIVSLARRYARSKSSALLPGFGPQRNGNGEQSARGFIALACLTGNVGVPGGCAAGEGVVSRHRAPVFPVPENPCPVSIPVFLWTDAIQRGTQMTAEHDGVKGADKLGGGIKMILNIAGNTLVNQHSDINKTAEILRDTSKCEFIVTSDLFMTPSARYSDLVLPAPSFLESENITTQWMNGDVIGYTNKIVEPPGECRFEYSWLKVIAKRLGLFEEFTAGLETEREWLQQCYSRLREDEPELPSFEKLRQTGMYQYSKRMNVVSFSEQRSDIDNNPFPTPSGKVEIYSPRLAALKDPAVPPIPGYVPAPEGPEDTLRKTYPLQMVGWHTLRRCHSIHDNNPALERIEPQRVWMNPSDAAERAVSDGDLVTVFNDRGKLLIPARVTDAVMPGVCAISQGAWYTPDKSGTDCAGSINVLTSQRPTPLAKGNPQHTNLVQVCKAEG